MMMEGWICQIIIVVVAVAIVVAIVVMKTELHGKSVRSWCDGLSDQSFMGWTH